MAGSERSASVRIEGADHVEQATVHGVRSRGADEAVAITAGGTVLNTSITDVDHEASAEGGGLTVLGRRWSWAALTFYVSVVAVVVAALGILLAR